MFQAIPISYSRAILSIETNCVNFINECNCSIFMRNLLKKKTNYLLKKSIKILEWRKNLNVWKNAKKSTITDLRKKIGQKNGINKRKTNEEQNVWKEEFIITSHKSCSGHTAPVMEWTVSKATIFGIETSKEESNFSRWFGLLCLKMCFGTPEFRMPCIMEAWFPSSEKIWQPKGNIWEYSLLLLFKLGSVFTDDLNS